MKHLNTLGNWTVEDTVRQLLRNGENPDGFVIVDTSGVNCIGDRYVQTSIYTKD